MDRKSILIWSVSAQVFLSVHLQDTFICFYFTKTRVSFPTIRVFWRAMMLCAKSWGSFFLLIMKIVVIIIVTVLQIYFVVHKTLCSLLNFCSEPARASYSFSLGSKNLVQPIITLHLGLSHKPLQFTMRLDRHL